MGERSSADRIKRGRGRVVSRGEAGSDGLGSVLVYSDPSIKRMERRFCSMKISSSCRTLAGCRYRQYDQERKS